MVTRLILGLCLPILSSGQASDLLDLPWPFLSLQGSPSFLFLLLQRELMGGDKTIPALFVPQLPEAQGFSGTMAQPGEATVC